MVSSAEVHFCVRSPCGSRASAVSEDPCPSEPPACPEPNTQRTVSPRAAFRCPYYRRTKYFSFYILLLGTLPVLQKTQLYDYFPTQGMDFQYSRTHAKAFLNGLPLKPSLDNAHTSGCSRPPAGPGLTGQLRAHPAGQAGRWNGRIHPREWLLT